MPISWIANAENSASPNATFNVTLPTGSMLAGDLVIGAFAVGDSPGADNNIAATGFTEVADLAITTDANDTELWVGYLYYTGSETQMPTSGNFTALGGTNASNAAVLQVFRGVASAAQGGPFSTASQPATGIDTSNADPPSISTVTNNAVVIVGATGHTGGATAAYTNPTGYTTNPVDRPHNDTVDALIGMGYNLSPSIGTENPGVMTAANIGTATDNSWCAVTMALKAAPVAYTSSADPGSYGLTGLVATSLTARLSSALPGVYALAGFAATSNKGIISNANPGSYALAGVAATSLAQRVSNAAAGAYTVSGTAATSLRGLVSTALAGAYALTGFNADSSVTGGGGPPAGGKPIQVLLRARFPGRF